MTEFDVQDESCCFLNVEAAGELPQEVAQQLRAFLRSHDRELYITRFDKTRLMELLRALDAAERSRLEIEELGRELTRGTEVESTEVAGDVVTMNSTMRVTDLDSGMTHVYTIVFPADADPEKGRVSILSPLGTALLGFRTGDVVTSETWGGARRLRIDELIYQPEAAGDFHL
ncbi:MAG TPA: GreA/GreB family elongation factor [Thermoanaerobaculia bacterium]